VLISKKRVYKQHTPAFKEEAVALVTEQGYSVAAAEFLGIRANQLYDWKQQQEASKADSALTVDERAELLRLRKENKQLRLEKEILNKVSAFFANEMR
jgi:transposase